MQVCSQMASHLSRSDLSAILKLIEQFTWSGHCIFCIRHDFDQKQSRSPGKLVPEEQHFFAGAEISYELNQLTMITTTQPFILMIKQQVKKVCTTNQKSSGSGLVLGTSPEPAFEKGVRVGY